MKVKTNMKYPTKNIENFLSNEEIDIIDQVVSTQAVSHPDLVHVANKPDDEDGLDVTTVSFFMDWPEYHAVRDILMPKIYAEFGKDIKIGSSHILNSRRPYGTHTDVISAGFEINNTFEAAWTFIIPLDNYDSHTITFDQGHDYIKEVEQWVKQLNIKPHGLPVDEQFVQEYLAHIPRRDLDYLTIQQMFKWKKGSLYAGDRRNFHTSDSHNLRGVGVKRAIIMWTEMPV